MAHMEKNDKIKFLFKKSFLKNSIHKLYCAVGLSVWGQISDVPGSGLGSTDLSLTTAVS